jgi:Fe-S-cluster-containing dehydrogenase component
LVGVVGDTPSFARDQNRFDNAMGVLVDIPNCIGCRKCEFACQEAAGFNTPPIESFEDKSVFAAERRPEPNAHTVINEYQNASNLALPVYAKVNCLHCNEPACVSACLVGALRKEATGAVVYDAWKCMGCRYCMVACPFQIPTYEYANALTPQVRKCNFCSDKIAKGEVPACVRICPNEALIFGKRSELIALAHEKIRAHPDKYVDHIYGENEVGGTSWMYLSAMPFEKLGFLSLPDVPPSRLTETIQHGVFKHFVPPFALYGILGLMMWLARQHDRPDSEPAAAHDGDHRHAHLPTQVRLPSGSSRGRSLVSAGISEGSEPT